MRQILFQALILLVVASAGQVTAHELRPGYLDVSEREPLVYDVVWNAPLTGGRPLAVTPAFSSDCTATGQASRQQDGRAVVNRRTIRCERPLAGQRIDFEGLGLTLSDVLVRVRTLDNKPQALRASPDEPFVTLSLSGSGSGIATPYFLLGVEHIAFGLDHLLFVFALVLLIRGWRSLAVTITAFTLAHSLTLVSAVLGWMVLPSRPVEAVIALSIVFLACEVASKQDGRMRLAQARPWLIAFVFGLLHGFGFAGALQEIGLPQGDVLLALLMFNLGVEAGQLLFVAGLLVVLEAFRRLGQRKRFERVVSYAIGITASFWLIERLV